MINVTNTSDAVLAPAGVIARPGATVAIDERRWKQFAGTREGKNLIRLGKLVAEASPSATKATMRKTGTKATADAAKKVDEAAEAKADE